MRRVMLVEDEDFILQGLENIIDWETLGLKIVFKAHNGVEALELLAKETADIIVTDVSMPLMDGLELLERVRRHDPVMRFIILTGYNEFEYARRAIRMDVENYILKPINEEELEKALKSCVMKLREIEDRKSSQIDVKVELLQFLEGSMGEEERKEWLSANNIPLMAKAAGLAIMKIELNTLSDYKISDVIRYMQDRCPEEKIRIRHLRGNNILLLLLEDNAGTNVGDWFANLQNEVEIDMGVMSFLTVSGVFTDLTQVPEKYRKLVKMQKYILIDGYGSTIYEVHIENRADADVVIDREKFFRFIVQKDVEAAGRYVEDLFINNMQDEVSVDVLYQIAVKIAILLQEIRSEYNLAREGRQLSDVLDSIYQAEDIFSIKALFLAEITDIISWLNTENTQYTPVVRQIMAEIRDNYREDMNLKTLAYKYHMNTSYLGQIFQREVGCPFTQYLNNVRNGVAKELILSTNMRINDIAREVGYSDTSYFYRKFKAIYGVSPAAMRDMKNY